MTPQHAKEAMDVMTWPECYSRKNVTPDDAPRNALPNAPETGLSQVVLSRPSRVVSKRIATYTVCQNKTVLTRSDVF